MVVMFFQNNIKKHSKDTMLKTNKSDILKKDSVPRTLRGKTVLRHYRLIVSLSEPTWALESYLKKKKKKDTCGFNILDRSGSGCCSRYWTESELLFFFFNPDGDQMMAIYVIWEIKRPQIPERWRDVWFHTFLHHQSEKKNQVKEKYLKKKIKIK